MTSEKQQDNFVIFQRIEKQFRKLKALLLKKRLEVIENQYRINLKKIDMDLQYRTSLHRQNLRAKKAELKRRMINALMKERQSVIELAGMHRSSQICHSIPARFNHRSVPWVNGLSREEINADFIQFLVPQ
jgi:hypothetical protein